ncbi:MAG: M23 family metallopeptidase [Alphaproteobacteria bacterium]|nr:M23 family metallopeptidase [Alphaproteobacteria bacterium]
MKQLKKFLNIFYFAGVLAFSLSTAPVYAQDFQYGFDSNSGLWGFNGGSNTNLGGCQKSSCSEKACELKSSMVDGRLPNNCPSGTRYDVDPNCVMNHNAKKSSCIDTMPVSSINRVSETNCYRANGAGGNSTPRNHYGTDYAANVGTAVTAAADGTITQMRWASGGGRSVVIEHKRDCQCGASDSNEGCNEKYHSVYYHLSAWADGIGVGTFVKKGDVIGAVGGSNTVGGKNCDYKTVAQYKGDCYSYGPHLHFEIHHGPHAGGANLKASMVDPLCDDIQTICGGCKDDVNECLNKQSTADWEKLSDEAAENKKVTDPPAWTSTGDSTPYVTPGQGSVTSTKCDYSKYMEDIADKCYFCPVFKVIFNAGSQLALQVYKRLANDIVQVVLVAFALWISLFVFKHVSALEVKKPSKMIQELLVQAFKVLIVVLILKVSYFQVLKLTIAPVFNTGMNYVQTISETKPCSDNASYMQNVKGFENELDTRSTGALPISMGKNILCSIKSMQDDVYTMVAIGKMIRCIGWEEKSILFGLIPSFPYVITGDFIIIGGLILLLAFPWCLVDCILNMAIASALLPAAIGAWPFKSTKKYLNKIWDMYMNAMFQFVFLSIILYIIMTVVRQFTAGVESYANDYTKVMHPVTGLAFWGINSMKLILVCFLGWVFLDQAKEIASKFAKAPSLGIGKKTGGLFAQGATRAAIGSKDKDGHRHGGALGVGKGVTKMGGLALSGQVIQPLKQRANSKRMDNIMQKGTAVHDANGNIIAYERQKKNILGQDITQKVTIDQNGQRIYSKEKLSRTGATVQSISKDHLLNIKELKATDGRILMQDISWNTPLADYLINEDGSVNNEILAQLESETNVSKELFHTAVAAKVLESKNLRLDKNFTDRKISYQNGVTTILQTNNDGSVSNITLEVGQNGQTLVNYQFTDKNGNLTFVTDNGIMTRRLTKNQAGETIAKYDFSQRLKNKYRYTQFLDKDGRVDIINEHDMLWGFDAYDKTLHMQQIANNGRAQNYQPPSPNTP